jgi:hypothetical protein
MQMVKKVFLKHELPNLQLAPRTLQQAPAPQ